MVAGEIAPEAVEVTDTIEADSGVEINAEEGATGEVNVVESPDVTPVDAAEVLDEIIEVSSDEESGEETLDEFTG